MTIQEPQLAANQIEVLEALVNEQTAEIGRLHAEKVVLTDETMGLTEANRKIKLEADINEVQWEKSANDMSARIVVLEAQTEIAAVSIKRAIELLQALKREKTTSFYATAQISLIEGLLRYDLAHIERADDLDLSDIPF